MIERMTLSAHATDRTVADLRELVKTGAGVAREELRAFALV